MVAFLPAGSAVECHDAARYAAAKKLIFKFMVKHQFMVKHRYLYTSDISAPTTARESACKGAGYAERGSVGGDGMGERDMGDKEKGR